MIRLLLATAALLVLSSGASGAQRIIGYQVGIVHVMDTDDCPAPTITSYALSDAVLERLPDPQALTRLYSEAIWWARTYCGTYNGEPLKLRLDVRIAGESVATLSLTDRKLDSAGDTLWWAERLSVSDVEVSDASGEQGPVRDFLQHLADSLLEKKDRALRESAARALLDTDLELLGRSRNPTIAFTIARLVSPGIGGDVEMIVADMANGSLYFDEQRGSECADDPSAMQRAADLGSPIAAFLIARCAVNLRALQAGNDLKAMIEREHAGSDARYSQDEAYERFMFHMAKALVGGYAPAYGVVEALSAYTDEFVRYAELLGEDGAETSIAELLEGGGGGGASAAVTGLPGKPETRQALNEQILLPNCSQLGVILASGNPAAALFSNIEARDGWCVTDNIGARINLRFGTVRTLDCQGLSEGRFDCAVSYDVDCRIDSFESTQAGNRMICGVLTALPASGRMQSVRRSDGVLVIERFSVDGNERFVQGRAPARTAPETRAEDTAAPPAAGPAAGSAAGIVDTVGAQRARIVADGETPYLLVDVTTGRSVLPSENATDGRIIFNISPAAATGFEASGDRLTFSASFSGTSREVVVIGSDVIAVYARETGQGIMFRE